MGIRIKQTAVIERMPAGEYVASIESIEQVPGQFSEQLRFRFTIQTGEHKGRSVSGRTNCRFSPRTKLYRWTQAALGGWAIPNNWDFDSEELAGRLVRIVVLTGINDDGGWWHRAQEVLPR